MNIPFSILLVEDNDADIRLMLEILKEGGIPNDFNVVTDGGAAMSYLRNESPFEDAKRPDIIFLDWNLPVKHGQEVLADIKGDPNLRTIPVVVMTTSEAQEDIEKAYHAHANCFITKPVDLDEFTKVAELVRSFWLTAVKLPVA